ncbi:MAG: maleylacetoacetate isomerase [Labrys sp. (in: a-proteobacteria)]
MSAGTLFDYWRSSASYRVRIALGLKGLTADQAVVNLRNGEQRDPAHLLRNPSGLVPVWKEGEFVLSQSLAIIEYLDETHPVPPLLPGDPGARAQIREIALMIAADIHPIANLRVLDKLTADHGSDAAARASWVCHWVGLGLAAVESRLRTTAGRFAVGDKPTLADCCLVPQLYNARRFEVDIAAFPTIARVEAACLALPAFRAAVPESQRDAA